MTSAERKFTIVASLLVTLSVGANLFALQGERRVGQSASTGLRSERPVAAPRDFEELNGVPTMKAAHVVPQEEGPAPASSMPEPGMNMADVVRGVQRELNARGYEAGSPDGVAGLVTRAAIMAYEHDYGLAITARPNEALLSRIVLGSSAPPATVVAQDARLTADAESVVKVVKQMLGDLGYQAGKVDGNITPQLRRAVRQFEIDQKLPESARISGPLVSRLARLQATGAKAQAAKRAGR